MNHVLSALGVAQSCFCQIGQPERITSKQPSELIYAPRSSTRTRRSKSTKSDRCVAAPSG